MVDVTTRGERSPQPGRVYVGWRYVQPYADPGPPPRRPRPPDADEVKSAWLEGSRRKEDLLNKPLKSAALTGTGGVALFALLGLAELMPWTFALVGVGVSIVVVLIIGSTIRQGERMLQERVTREEQRVERLRDDNRRRLNDAHAEHARAYQDWERRKEAYESQQEWYPVSVPEGVDRLDVAGGTLAGWTAMVTMMGSARLAAGSEVTVLDLTEGAVARDLVDVARDQGEDPLVWVLPSDLPRLDLTQGLGPEALADVLSLVVSVSEDQDSTRDLSFDNAILERVLAIFGGTATIPQINAALRALAQVGDPRDDLADGLITDDELAKVGTMFGRGAVDRVVIERAWALESQLRKLETLGSDPVDLPYGRLRVVSTDRRAGVLTNRVLGTYVATTLTHVLRASTIGQPWAHTLFLCGAEKLRGDVLDRLTDACEATSTGLVLMYRSIPMQVKDRLGRGDAAVGFMRLGNIADARLAAEHIGSEHRLVVARLTEGVGGSVTEPKEEAYTSTVDRVATGGGGRRASRRLPVELVEPSDDAPRRPASGLDEASLAERIGRSTAWGHDTSVIAEAGETGGQTGREFLVEAHELQRLPPTAMVFTHATRDGRRVLFLDANPGIVTLPTAQVREYEDGVGSVPRPRGRHAAYRGGLSERPPEPPEPVEPPEPPEPPEAVEPSGPSESSEPPESSEETHGAITPLDDLLQPAEPSEPAEVDFSNVEPSDLERPDAEPIDAEPIDAEPPSEAAVDAEPDPESPRDPQRRRPGSPGGYIRPGEKPPPNLGPPPERLDFRRKKRR